MNTETLFNAWKNGSLTEEMVREYYRETDLRFINIGPEGVQVCIAARNNRECDYWEELFQFLTISNKAPQMRGFLTKCT